MNENLSAEYISFRMKQNRLMSCSNVTDMNRNAAESSGKIKAMLLAGCRFCARN